MLITPFSYCQFEKFPIITEILVFLELALGQRLFFVLFPVSHCQTALFTPSSEHYKNLLEGL